MNRDFVEPSYGREINYTKIIGTILSRWYWVAACVTITVSLAWLYLSLIHPRYSANASIMLNDKKSNIAQILSSETSDNGSNTYDSYNLAQSATFIIRSDAFLSKAVADLNYRYSFFVKEAWSYEELYPESPFTIEIIKQDTTGFYSGLFAISNVDNKSFKLSDKLDDPPQKIYKYGDIIQAPGLRFRITSTAAAPDALYYFRFETKERLATRAAATLSIDPQNANILSLTHTDVNPNFSADILNAISKQFIIYESYQRRLSATQRLKFIDNQLDTLSKEVNISATDLESFKKQNNLDNLPAKVQADIQRIAQQEAQKQQLELERLSIEQLERQIAINDPKAKLNFNLEGQIGSLLSTLVSQLNDQIYERERKLEVYTPNAAPVLESDKKIAMTKASIAANIKQTRERNETNQNYLNAQINASKATLEALPSDAKDFINLQTEYTIKQKIFSNLVEERLRSSIALAAIEPGASIIYSATPSYFAIWPVPKRIYFMALLAGLGLGVFLIFFARLLNKRVRDIGTVHESTSIPILGMIRRLKNPSFTKDNSTIALVDQPESVFAESVRSLRNSLVFELNKTQAKIICISSEQSGEGRSFTSINLGCSLAQLEKKILIIDADLRKPSVDKNWGEEQIGLSAYLMDYKSSIDIIQNTKIRNLDIIPSGITPPNPSELLQNSKMDDLLGFLKNIYDYIIIDTSPVGVVSDAISVITKADINLFILRSGVSGFNALPRLEKIVTDYKANNFFIILNGFRKDPLYQSFYSSANMSLYFNRDFLDYTRKYGTNADERKWRWIRHSES